MRVLGIDPGIAIVGFGFIDKSGHKLTPVQYGAITTEAHTPQESLQCVIAVSSSMTRLHALQAG